MLFWNHNGYFKTILDILKYYEYSKILWIFLNSMNILKYYESS